MERLTERNPSLIYDEIWEMACEPDFEEIFMHYYMGGKENDNI